MRCYAAKMMELLCQISKEKYFSGEMTDIWEHLYCALLRNLVSIMTTDRTADYVILNMDALKV